MKKNQKKNIKKVFLSGLIFIIFILTNCSTQNTPSAKFPNVNLKEDVSISSFKKVPEVPKEDIEKWNKIMDEIVKQYPLKRSSKSVKTKATNPTNQQIIDAMKMASTKYNVPYEVLYGIAYEESNLKQFKSDGQPLISGDGGIGITQVTPWAVDERFDEYSLKWDYQYNIEAGAQVILGKWKYASNRNPIGDNNPLILENWYLTIWAYNGYSNINNPNNYINGPKEWCNDQICWTRIKAYQDEVLETIFTHLGINITSIPLNQLPTTGIPSSGLAFNTPNPIHYTNGETFDPTNAEGSHNKPYEITSFPYVNYGTTIARETIYNNYSCSSSNEAGPEQVYKLILYSKGKLSVSITDGSGVDIDIHLLSELDNTKCLIRHDTNFEYDIPTAGTYYIVADTWNNSSNAGSYTINVDFKAETDPGSHTQPYIVNRFPFSKDSTTINKESKFNGYNCSASIQTGPEEVYQINIIEKGKLTVNVTDGSGVDIDIHLLSALDNNSCLTRHDTHFEYDVDAGTYYIIADTWNGDNYAGDYKINISFEKIVISGSHETPYEINSFTFTNNSTTVDKQSRFNSYNCSTADESGAEEVYKVTVSEAGELNVTINDGSDYIVDLDVHLLSTLDNNSCLVRADNSFNYEVTPGTYYIVVDSYKGKVGSYNITVKFSKNLFSEIFDENKNLSGWIPSSSNVVYYTGSTKIGSAAMRVRYNDNVYTIVSTVGYENIKLKFKIAAYSLESGESFIAEYNYGSGWIQAGILNDGDDNSTYQSYYLSLETGANNNNNLKIRFRSIGNSSYDYGYIDNVYVVGTTQ